MNRPPPSLLAVEPRPGSPRRPVQVALIAVGLITGVLVLFHFPPETNGFYPRCLLYTFTGWQCPGCGGLRAAHHLLHGEFATAFHYNALFVLLLPLLPLWFAAPAFKRKTGLAWLDFTRHPSAFGLLLAVALIFGIARNLIH